MLWQTEATVKNHSQISCDSWIALTVRESEHIYPVY